MSYPINFDITYTAFPDTPGYVSSDHTLDWSFSDYTVGTGLTVVKQWATVGTKTATVVATNKFTHRTAIASKTVDIDTFTWQDYGPSTGLPTLFSANPGYAIIGHKLYIAGTVKDGIENGLAIYDFDTDTWLPTKTMPITYSGSASNGMYVLHELPILSDGRIYFRQQGSAFPPYTYDPASDSWVDYPWFDGLAGFPPPDPPLPYVDIYDPWLDCSVAIYADNIYYFGVSSRGTSRSNSNIIRHDLSGNTPPSWAYFKRGWYFVAQPYSSDPTNDGLTGFTHVFPDGKALNIGHSGTVPMLARLIDLSVAPFAPYTLSSNTSSIYTSSVASFNMVVIDENRVMLTGTMVGFTGATIYQEIFDRRTMTFTRINDAVDMRTRPGLFKMADGRVHIIGDSSICNSYIYDLEMGSTTGFFTMNSDPNSKSIIVHPINGKPLAIRIYPESTIKMQIFNGK